MSSSKSKSKSSTKTTSTPISLQDVEGLTIAGNSAGKDLNLNITDGGAISAMGDLSSLTVEKAAEVTLGILDRQIELSNKVFDTAKDAQDKGYQFAMDAGRSDAQTMKDMTKGLLIIGGIMAAGVAAKSMKG